MVITTLVEHNKIEKPFILKYQKWFPLALQFFLGGLFSAYVIFYFQSASFTKTSLFLGILVLLLTANEFLEKTAAKFVFVDCPLFSRLFFVFHFFYSRAV